MNRQQLHGLRFSRLHQLQRPAFESADEAVKAGITPAVQIERQRQKRVDRMQAAAALAGRHGGGQARVQITVGDDAVEQIMRRTLARQRGPAWQQLARPQQCGAERLVGRLQHIPPGQACWLFVGQHAKQSGAAGQPGELQQVRLIRTQQRTAQRVGQ